MHTYFDLSKYLPKYSLRECGMFYYGLKCVVTPKGHQTLLYSVLAKGSVSWGLLLYVSGIINYDFDLSVSQISKKRGQNINITANQGI